MSPDRKSNCRYTDLPPKEAPAQDQPPKIADKAASGFTAELTAMTTVSAAKDDAGRGLAGLVKDGMRAFTIESKDPAARVGGMLQPGDRVDVLFTSAGKGDGAAGGGGAGGGVTTTLLQDIQVLAVVQKMDTPANAQVGLTEAKHVTLLVTPEQVARLDLAMNSGVLHLSLRNPGDRERTSIAPIQSDQLFGDRTQPRALPPIVQEGKRAVTILTQNLAARVGGMIKPGDKVDVLLTLFDAQDVVTGGAVTKTLLHNVKVLAVAMGSGAAGTAQPDQSSVTLEVTRDQATELALGQAVQSSLPSRAIIQLILRNSEDDGDEASEPANIASFGNEGIPRHLASKVKDGMRAYTVTLPEPAPGLAGTIQAGDNVDVLLTLGGKNEESSGAGQTNSGEGQTIVNNNMAERRQRDDPARELGRDDKTGGGWAFTLLQDVPVLAVLRKVDAEKAPLTQFTGVQHITMLVTPNQAAMLALAEHKGTLHLTLRNPNDNQKVPFSGASMEQLRSDFRSGRGRAEIWTLKGPSMERWRVELRPESYVEPKCVTEQIEGSLPAPQQ